MEKDASSGAGTTPPPSDDSEQGRKSLLPLSQAQSPKQATLDVHALYDLTDPTFLAAVQRLSQVKKGHWMEVKLRESDGNILDID